MGVWGVFMRGNGVMGGRNDGVKGVKVSLWRLERGYVLLGLFDLGVEGEGKRKVEGGGEGD